MKTVYIDGQSLTLEDVELVANRKAKVEINPNSVDKINKSRKFVDDVIQGDEYVYGINTGFGALSSVIIAKDKLERLQLNLVRSHACGVGDYFEEPSARAIILLRANTLARGFSGIRLTTLEKMFELLNKGVTPAIPKQGSVGASGDLAPLAHLAIVLVGEGKAFYNGKLLSGADALKEAGIEPVVLGAKEGLALTNGTQAMCGTGVLSLLRAEKLAKIADIAAAMSVEAMKCTSSAFDPRIQQLRGHKGQIKTADNLLKLLNNSKIAKSHENCNKIQDPYSIRCIPQVHGAARDVFAYVRQTLETEINAVTDNPIIFADDNDVISGGNFHGQPVAFAMDFLGIASSELASISERRIDKLITPNFSGLPAFLTDDFGLNSGLMIVQYAAASLVSENKVLAHPASVDSIPTSLDKEDHVSMGTTAAVKAERILNNVQNVIAIELLAAFQGLSFHEALDPGEGVLEAYRHLENYVPKITEDRVFSYDIKNIYDVISSGTILETVENCVGKLY
ncbi:MAG: histidine ammonia-lyase [bacterium]